MAVPSKAAAKSVAAPISGGSAGSSDAMPASTSKARQPSLISVAQKAKAKAKPKSRHVCRRDSEEQAERALKSHFPDWNKEQTHLFEVDGKSMIAQVVEDKRALKGTKSKLGPHYWSDLRDKYRQDDKGKLVPDPRDAKLDVSGDLISALELARTGSTTDRTMRPLINFLDSVTSLNAREVIGLANHCLDLRPGINLHSRQVILAVMKVFARLNIKERQPVVIRRLKTVFDEGMMTCYGELRKNNVQLEDFWPIYRDQCCLILDPGHAERVMQQSGSWMAVARELKALTAGSQLGSTMFGEFHECVVSEKVHVALRKSISMMQREQMLDRDTLDRCAADFEAEVKGTEARKILLKKRLADVTYRGLHLQIEVTSIDEELQLARASWVKTHAIPEDLEELKFERGILQDGSRSSKKEIAPELLQEYASARLAAKAMLEPCEGGIQILDKLETKLTLLTAIDATFVIEVAACRALVNKAGLRLVQDAVLKSLPTAQHRISLDMALHGIQKLQSSPLYDIVSADGKGVADATASILSKMQSGVGPSRTLLANTDFLQQVVTMSY